MSDAVVFLTFDRFVELLEHNKANARNNDIWVLTEKDGVQIVPDQNTTELMSPRSWPMYICRAEAVNAHISYDSEKASDAVDGLYAALDHINWAINLQVHPVKTIVRFAINAWRR
ncbi:hypothetical protein [Rhodococcus sp. IEGM 1330]|uniref:hypothetical protein n=1 Tax=Rhodococcus sp. IEGM 1330 TaxID=3082225 RepID=UPI0029546EDA|nr:hypothetical protein [Rhodococcus sp. IEGM 1330]MDV8022249.1 hypothetical protein [Rhodococcus sp. IEGM 1330]